MNYALGIVLAALAALLGWLVGRRISPQPEVSREDTQRLLDSAKAEAEKLKQDAQVESKEILLRAQREVESELRSRRAELEREADRSTNSAYLVTTALRRQHGRQRQAILVDLCAVASMSGPTSSSLRPEYTTNSAASCVALGSWSPPPHADSPRIATVIRAAAPPALIIDTPLQFR